MANLIEVKKSEDGKFLYFVYDDKPQEKYKICKSQTNILPYVRARIGDEDTRIRQIIENESDVKQLSETNAGFINCIFLIKAEFISTEGVHISFSNVIFAEKVNFSVAKFTGTVSFSNTTFIKDVDFSLATFKQAIFFKATFTENADFTRATFTENADFSKATFTENADFTRATFTENANFSKAKFKEEANFSKAKFKEEADFSKAKFSRGTINFSQTQFLDSINFNGVRTNGFAAIDLDLEQAQLDRVFYSTDTKFRADNRETFLILKDIALKQHDRIKALEFYKQEYEQHQKSLKWRENFGDNLILSFEQWISYFGTTIIWAIFWLLLATALFYFTINGSGFDWGTLVDFFSPTTYKVGDIVSNPSGWDKLLFLFYKIIQFTLIYEMIKSLRKFSRNL